MPVVPKAQRQVADAPTPPVRVGVDAPLESFGGGRPLENLERSSVGVSQVVFDIAEKEKKKADDTAVQDAYNQTVSLKNRLFYDPEAGAITRGGKDVFGIFDEYGKQFDDESQAIEDSLSSEEQKARYRLLRDKQRNDFNNDLNRHTFNESRKFENDTFKSTIDITKRDAILHFQDEAKTQESIDLIRGTIKDFADKNGLPDAWSEMLSDQTVSEVRRDAINRMLANGEDITAKSYFNKYKQEVSGEHITQLEKSIEEGSLRGKSQRASDNIVTKSKTLDEAIDKARAIQNPELRDETLRRVKQYYSDEKLAQDSVSSDALNSAVQIVDKDPRRDAIPPDMWTSMNLEDRGKITNYIKKVRSGGDTATHWPSYQELADLASNNRSKFKQVNLLRYVDKLSNEHLKQFIDIQAGLKKGKEAKYNEFLSKTKAIEPVLNDIGLDPQTKSKKKKNQIKQVQEYVDRRGRQFFEQTGKQPTNEDWRSFARDAGAEFVIQKSYLGQDWLWPDQRKKLFEMGLEDWDDVKDVVIPESEKQQIMDAYRRKTGKNPKDSDIRRIYVKGLTSG